jgi:hypothetical protein
MSLKEYTDAVATDALDELAELRELEAFFSAQDLPSAIRLNQATMITNLPRMIQTDLKVARNYAGNHLFKHSIDRLRSVKSIIEKNKDEK